MSLKIYNCDSNDAVFVQPDAWNRISVDTLNIEFGENVVALEVLTTDNAVLKLYPNKSGYFRRRRGWWNSTRKVTAIFSPRQHLPLTKPKRRRKRRKPKLSLPEFVDFECDDYIERVLVDKNGTISCDDVYEVFQCEVVLLKFTQKSSCFMITPKKTRRFKLPKLNWTEPFDVEPIFYNIYEHVQIASDNGKTIDICPDTNGDLILNDTLFGREVQALDINYQNMIYRLKPVTKNVFKEPELGWENCDFIKAILATPKVQKRVVDYSYMFDRYPSFERNYFHDPYFDDWDYNSANYKHGFLENYEIQKPVEKPTSWKMWFFKKALLIVLIIIEYIWRDEIYAQLKFFANPLRHLRKEVKSSWFSWLWKAIPTKQNLRLDPLSQMINGFWERFFNVF